MDQSSTPEDDDVQLLVANGDELSANQNAPDDETFLLSEGAFGHADGSERPKHHGVWCRVKTLSLTGSARERGLEFVEQDEKDGGRASRLASLKRLRKRRVRQEESKHQLVKAERKLRRQTDHQEAHIHQLNDVIKELQATAKMNDKTVEELKRKLHYAEGRIISSNRQAAKLNGLLELAKLQGDAQQQVVDVKQNDVIKMAVKQAELYDQIRKLKLTIESLRNKLERYEMDGSSTNPHQSLEESVEHPANLPLPSPATGSMNPTGPGGRDDDHSDAVQGEALNRAPSSRESGQEISRRPQLRRARWILIKRAVADANRRIRYQRAKITALRANVKIKDGRIQSLIAERRWINHTMDKMRKMAEIKLNVVYRNILSLPDALNSATAPLNIGETILTYLNEVDSAAPVEEVRRIISRLKEFGKFLDSDESFDDFMKDHRRREDANIICTLEAATQTANTDVTHPENDIPLRILRRQKTNRRILEGRCRVSRRRLSSTSEYVEHVGRLVCGNLGQGGKRCTCCCCDTKTKGTLSPGEQLVQRKSSCIASTSASSPTTTEPTQGTEIKIGDSKVMLGSVCPVVSEDTGTKTKESMIGEQQPEISDGNEGEECSPDLSDGGNDQLVTEDIAKDVPPVIGVENGQSTDSEDGPEDQEESSGRTVYGTNVASDQRSEDDLEKNKDLIKRVSDLLVDKWCLEGQVKALVDNEKALTAAKSEICPADTTHRQLERSSSDMGRLQQSHHELALGEKVVRLQGLVKEMEEQRDEDLETKHQLQHELANSRKRVDDLEAAKKRLEGEVEGWMETVMEVRRGRINLLNHMGNITDKVGKLGSSKSFTDRKNYTIASVSKDHLGGHSPPKETCSCTSHDVMRVHELKADIETLTEQRKIQDFQIEQLSGLLQKANDQKQQLMNHLAEVQQERSNLQLEFDLLLAHE